MGPRVHREAGDLRYVEKLQLPIKVLRYWAFKSTANFKTHDAHMKLQKR
jgi:hypothetical protein